MLPFLPFFDLTFKQLGDAGGDHPDRAGEAAPVLAGLFLDLGQHAAGAAFPEAQTGRRSAASLRKWLKRAPRPMLASAVFFAIAFIINHSGKGLDWQLADPAHNMVYVIASASAAAFGRFYPVGRAVPGAVGRVCQRLGDLSHRHADRHCTSRPPRRSARLACWWQPPAASAAGWPA